MAKNENLGFNEVPEHTYPKSKKSDMSPIKDNVIGDSKKANSAKGPHLLHGKGNAFHQAKITKGFLAADPRPGHTQKKNIDK